MSNNLLYNGIIVKEALPILRNKLPMVMMANKDYQSQITEENARVNGIINIKRPPRYLGRDGELMKIESTVESSIPMQLSLAGVDVSFSQRDLQLTMDDVKRGGLNYVLEPAMTAIAAKIEAAGTALYRQVSNVVGTPGTTPTALSTISSANAYIDALGGSIGSDRIAAIDSFASASLADSLRLQFNPNDEVSKAYMKGRMGSGYGFDFYTDPAIQTHTAGIYGGTPLVNGASQTGSSLITDGWTVTTTTLNVGDTFTIAGVNSVNPQTRQDIGKLQSFVVTAKTVTDGSGNSTISIFPAIVPSGQFQNVTAAPADNAAITVTSGASGTSSRQSLLYDKNAFTFASAPMALPNGNGVNYAGRAEDKMSGLSISLIQQYDAMTNQMLTRFDVLYAWAATLPELAVRLQG
jgi:hypothetical protein